MGNINNSGTTRQGRYTKILSDLGIKLADGAIVASGATNPSVTAYDAPKGSIYLSSLTGNMYVKQDSGSSTDWHPLDLSSYTKEATGFLDNDLIRVDYNTTTTYVVLTNATSGVVEFLLRNRYYAYTSPWTVTTVLGGATPIPNNALAVDGTYFLKVDPVTLTVSFDTNPWNFTQLQICAVFKNPTAHFGLREIHGLMPYQSHESDHYTKGTYIRTAAAMTSGTAFTSTTSATATTASNCPGIDAHTIYDEDISSLVNAWPEASYTTNTYNSGNYTTAYRNGASTITFNTTAQLPYITAGGGVGILQYNPITAGLGALANVTEDSYVNVFAMSVPVTADTDSQKFRTVFFTGQVIFTTLAAAQLEVSTGMDLGQWTSLAPERYTIQSYQYQYNAAGGTATPAGVLGRAFLASLPVVFTGSRNSSTSVTGISPSDHATLSGRTAATQHPLAALYPTTANRVIVSNAGNTAIEETTTTTTELNVLNSNASNAYRIVNFDSSGNTRVDGTDAHILASGTLAQRPGTPLDGMIRYNSDYQMHESYRGTSPNGVWACVGSRYSQGTLSSAGSGTTVFIPPAACTGYNMLLWLYNGANYELVEIRTIVNGAANWEGSIASVAGTDLNGNISITTADGSLVVDDLNGTYKVKADGFIF